MSMQSHSYSVMAQSKRTPKGYPERLKFTPRRKDLKAATSPAVRLLRWLRA